MAYNISGAAGALGAEAIELRNWLLCFGCASEEFRVIVTNLDDWMATPPPPPWAAYRGLMACRLVALDKCLWVRPIGIGETLRRAITRLFMRAVGDQAKTACGSLQLCAGIEDDIEGATNTVAQTQQERNALVTEGGADEESTDARTAAAGGAESAGGAAAVGGVGEVSAPPEGRQTP